MDKTQAAMAAYQKALRQNPESAKAYLGLGISLKSLGKARLAKKALLKAVNLDPRLPSALVHLGYLYAEGPFWDSGSARQPVDCLSEAAQLGDRFAAIALLDLKSDPKLFKSFLKNLASTVKKAFENSDTQSSLEFLK